MGLRQATIYHTSPARRLAKSGPHLATVARMSVITLPASGPYRGGGFFVADATLPPWPRISAGLWDRELPAQSNPLLGC